MRRKLFLTRALVGVLVVIMVPYGAFAQTGAPSGAGGGSRAGSEHAIRFAEVIKLPSRPGGSRTDSMTTHSKSTGTMTPTGSKASPNTSLQYGARTGQGPGHKPGGSKGGSGGHTGGGGSHHPPSGKKGK